MGCLRIPTLMTTADKMRAEEIADDLERAIEVLQG
jgi:hypothetical protein